MESRLVVVTGTGTGIGKTHVSEALLLAWKEMGVRAAGIKPVESGVDGSARPDAERLAAASVFHVQHSAYALRTPVAPHVAARLEGVTLELDRIRACVRAGSRDVDVVLLELPGGLFSPLTDDTLNAQFAASLAPDAVLLVAPDRLGVLHDVLATVRAATTVPLRLDGTLLVSVDVPDASSGTNAAELSRLAPVPVLATVPRGTPADLAVRLTDVARALLR
jgi:dethiobiotin synthetase